MEGGKKICVCAAAGLEKQLDLLVVGYYQGPLLFLLMQSLMSVTGQSSRSRKPRQSSMGVFAALLAVVVAVMLICGVGAPISSTAVAQHRGSALPSNSQHEHRGSDQCVCHDCQKC